MPYPTVDPRVNSLPSFDPGAGNKGDRRLTHLAAVLQDSEKEM